MHFKLLKSLIVEINKSIVPAGSKITIASAVPSTLSDPLTLRATMETGV